MYKEPSTGSLLEIHRVKVPEAQGTGWKLHYLSFHSICLRCLYSSLGRVVPQKSKDQPERLMLQQRTSLGKHIVSSSLTEQADYLWLLACQTTSVSKGY